MITAHRMTGDQPWLLPLTKLRRAGEQPKAPHISPRTLNGVLEDMPGVNFATQAYRRAAASYGPADLGWAPDDAKILLDHMEGFDPGDVTAQHYNSDPAIAKKRKMIAQWIGWLEKQTAAAIATDPILLDRDAIAEQVYRNRYGDERWRAAVKRCGRSGATLPWLLTKDEKERLKLERRRKKAEQAAENDEPPAEAAE